MLLVSLTLVAIGFGLWFTYMVRYPKSWEARIDGWHEKIRPLGLSFDWMRRMEKGITLKILFVVSLSSPASYHIGQIQIGLLKDH